MKIPIKFFPILMLLSSCATVDLSVKRGYNFGGIGNIGTLPFQAPQKARTQEMGLYAADVFSQEMLSLGFSVIERSQIEKVIEELHLGQSGTIDPAMAKEVGRIAGVDAMIYGSITPAIGEKTVVRSPGRMVGRGRRRRYIAPKTATRPHADIKNINLSAKMVLVETGEILWAGSAQAEGNNSQDSIKKSIQLIAKRLKKELF